MLEELREIITEYVEVAPEEIVPMAVLRTDLGATSFDLMNIAAAIEERYRLSIPDSSLPVIKTVEDVLCLMGSAGA